MQFTGYKCNECGKVKGDANNWFLARAVWRNGTQRLIIGVWTPDTQDPEEWEHYCSQEHWLKRILA